MSIEDSIRQTVEEQVQKATRGAFSRLNSENYSLQERVKFLEGKLEEAMLLLKDRNRDFTKGDISTTSRAKRFAGSASHSNRCMIATPTA